MNYVSKLKYISCPSYANLSQNHLYQICMARSEKSPLLNLNFIKTRWYCAVAHNLEVLTETQKMNFYSNQYKVKRYNNTLEIVIVLWSNSLFKFP